MEPIRFTPIPSQPITPKGKQLNPTSSKRFADELQGVLAKSDQLKISKHANDRLMQRNIDITDAQWQRVEEKVNEAKLKGINDSLVLLNDAALIVSVKKQTVITAMGMADINNQIFTDIDGTIILKD
ncbi:TIGR02530 family flagellar biosynthesis protein [Jeotgalibacillus marinus]|uniref:TIGR02530 family flagellar biosynthesis protein n=1 Tax=Jeotgalibacillus marinus TaxID=86667 RepID=A0ABV3Q1R9_9BACL